jgi:hypothetical protein
VIPREVLVWAILLEALVVAVTLLAIGGHVARGAVLGPRRTRRLAAVRERLAMELADGADPTSVAAALAGLRRRESLTILAEYAPLLAGADRSVLTHAAAAAGLTDDAVRRARSRRWSRRLEGARILTVVGGGDEVMPALLDDRSARVRSQASAWAMDHPSEDVIARLVRGATDPRPAARFSVQDALIRLGPAAVPALRDALERAEGQDAERLLAVCVAVADRAFGPAALRLLHDPSPAVRVLAAPLVARTAADEGASDLVALLGDPSPEVRAAACEALGVAQHWPAGGALRRALRDEAWTVRHAAAVALERLGPPGTLLLKRALDDDALVARDMARRMLELPTGEAV